MPRTPVLLLVCALIAAPVGADARPKAAATRGAEPAFDQAAFSVDFAAADAAHDAGRFADAARLRHSAARHVPEAEQHKDSRAALYRDIAGDFVAASEQVEDEALLREAVATLDEYIAGFSAAYPGEAVSPIVTAAREELQRRLAALQAARRPPPPVFVAPAPAPVTRPGPGPGRGMQIAGGLGFGVGAIVWLATLPAGYRRVHDASNTLWSAGCSTAPTESLCVQANGDYGAAKRLATTGWAVGSLFLAAGVTMFVVGTVRRSRSTVAPAISATSLGLTWQGRF